jgi:hypothetical protein
MATVEQIRQLDRFLQAMREADLTVAPRHNIPHQSSHALRDASAESDASSAEQIAASASASMAQASTSETAQWLNLGVTDDSIADGFQAHSQHTQRLIQLHRQLAASLVYPLVVCLLALVFLGNFRFHTAPLLTQLQNDPLILDVAQGAPSTRGMDGITLMAAFILTLLIVLMSGWMLLLARSRQRNPGSPGAIHWLPGARAITRDSMLAALATQARILCQKGVPIDAALQQASLGLTGRKFDNPPPLLHWIAETGSTKSAEVAPQLALAANLYQERAQLGADRLRWVVPTLFLALVGGGAALLYGYLFWSPFCQILTRISEVTIPI